MNPHPAARRGTLRFWPTQAFVTRVVVVVAAVAGCSTLSQAQTPLPSATPANTVAPAPIDTPTPAPSATPVASPGDTPEITVTPGVPDIGTMTDYIAARTPLASVALAAATTATSQTNGVKAATRTAQSTNPAISLGPPQGGVFTHVHLPPLTGTNTVPPMATITLTYDASHAGQAVRVQALTGGTLSFTDANGNTSSTTDGFLLYIGPAGTITFSFQAPGIGGNYQVSTRLDNVATTLSFLVPDTSS